MSQSEKNKLLEEQFKKLGIDIWNINKNQNFMIDSIPTGSFMLDKASGTKGWPAGKIIEIFGTDSSGKSTIALHAIAEAQKQNKTCVYIDLENTLNKEWAKKINVQIDKMYICTPNSGEQSFETINTLVKNNQIDLIVVDSVAAMVPQIEFINNFEDQTMGMHARLMSKGLRILQSNLINSKTTVIFINQIREKITNTFIPLTTTTGGRALRYASSLRVEIKKCEAIKQQEKIIGFNTKAIIVKNKFNNPMITVNLGLYFESGFDHYYEIINEAINQKILEKKGSWFSYKNKNLAQGLAGIKNYLTKEKELFSDLQKQVLKQENLKN